MAHNLKIAGAEYSTVSKVTFTDTAGTSRAYLDADEVYTKDQAAQLIKNDKNAVKDIAITLTSPDVIIWAVKTTSNTARPAHQMYISCG